MAALFSAVFTPEECKKSDATEKGTVIGQKVPWKSSRCRCALEKVKCLTSVIDTEQPVIPVDTQVKGVGYK